MGCFFNSILGDETRRADPQSKFTSVSQSMRKGRVQVVCHVDWEKDSEDGLVPNEIIWLCGVITNAWHKFEYLYNTAALYSYLPY